LHSACNKPIGLPKYSKKQNSEKKQTEAEHTQFLQPELRFVASEQETKTNRAGAQQKNHNTWRQCSAAWLTTSKILATKPDRHRTKTKRIWQAPEKIAVMVEQESRHPEAGVFQARMLVAVAGEQWLRLLPGA
jgi:hypothetical protein